MKLLAIFQGREQIQEFALAELRSLVDIYIPNYPLEVLLQHENLDSECFSNPCYLLTKHQLPHYPFVLVELPCLQVADCILQRSILCKAFLVVLAQGTSYQQLMQNVDQQYLQQYDQPGSTHSLAINSVNKKLPLAYQNQQIKYILDQILPQSKINLDNPQIKLKIYENHKYSSKDQKERYLDIIYFCHQILKNKKGIKQINKHFLINERVYCGPTSADPVLGFLMANQAQVMANDLVLDPFCGTGGLLVPCGVLGAMCYGSDIDYRVLQGTGVGRLNYNSQYYQQHKQLLQNQRVNMFTTFQQYSLTRPNLIQFDITTNRFTRKYLFDAIVCDPPYGIRATIKKTGLKNTENLQQAITNMNNAINKEDSEYFPATKRSDVNELVYNMFEVSEQLLKPKGRLVFLYPWIFSLAPTLADVIANMPTNSHFTLVDVTQNTLMNNKRSRLCFTYQKI